MDLIFPKSRRQDVFRLPWMTHPTVALQEEVTALPVAIGVRGFIDDFKDGLPKDKAIHSL